MKGDSSQFGVDPPQPAGAIAAGVQKEQFEFASIRVWPWPKKGPRDVLSGALD